MSLPAVRCPVCGAPPEPPLWRCEQCETPHHDECARWFGGCGIYGCRDGKAPARMETDTWPAAARVVDGMLRVQRWRLRLAVATAACALAAPLALVLAWVGQAWVLPVMVPAMFGMLGLVALLDERMPRLRAQLERETGPERIAAAEASWHRIRQVLPASRLVPAPVRWLSHCDFMAVVVMIILSVAGMFAAALCKWVLLVVLFAFTSSLGALALLGLGSAAAGHRTIVEVTARLEAMYAPRAAELKPAPPKDA